MEALTDRVNLKLELRTKEDSTNQNEGDDRVSELLGILKQMMDREADMKDEGIGFKISRSTWKHLEGFDFMDIARRSDSFHPKGVVFNEGRRGWVDFTRAIHAVTPFSHGFGDLLCPIGTEQDACARCH
ncbi:hypothetical protein GP486_006724 [Trichoglossum hirsutum]|uniref:Uncharacterized protein n=1 Tax=Trichoglossum hirsutum TaxID=265104 RepID=A0A9P8L5D4_9PEZI|nr:hypothetical protein GP486_006724 [Trichoglossum hirsutum]